MFKEIFAYELKQWLKRPGVYIYFFVFLALAFLLGAAISGIFSGVSADTNSYINSATTIAGILTSFNTDYLFGLITLLICVALMAGCVQKDFQYNCFSFYFTKPITKFSYLFGRFSASFLLTAFVLTGIVFGIFIAFLLANNDNGQLGEFNFINFFQPFIYFLLPNVFFIGTLFFSLVTFTRNMTSGYVGSLVFIVVAGISRSIVSDIDNKTVAALLDPFGAQALSSITEYWTPAESNTRLIPFSGYLLYNRLLWIGLSFALLMITYYRFDFNQFLNPVSIFKRKSKETKSQPSKAIQSIGHLPKVTQVFDRKLAMEQLLFLTKFEFSKIFKSIFFVIILGLSVLLVVVVSQFSGLIYGTETYPVTYMQIELASGTFGFFQMIMIVFYSGILIWREKDAKIDELIGSTPVKNWILFISKFFSLVAVALIINLVCICTCIFIQSLHGYTKFELGLYFTDLILLKIFSVALLVALGLSMQVFFKNRYVAFFIMAFIVLGFPLILRAMDYDNDLFKFNSTGEAMKYSDMNGHGQTLPNYFVFKAYWIGFTLMIGTLAIALYQRGKEQKFSIRWKSAKKGFKRSYKMTFILGLICFLGFGSVIYYNTRVLNIYKTDQEEEKQMAEFEKKYKKYEKELQPRVVESNVNVDIYPNKYGAKAKGFYYLKNKHKQPLTKIFINYYSKITINNLAFNLPAKLFVEDKKNGFYGYELITALQPNDSIKFDFDIEFFPKNFIMRDNGSEVVENGSFLNSGIFPSIGYNKDSEISENASRKKYGLSIKPRMAGITDTAAYANTYISHDADWIRFQCIVSTTEGQTAIAPGYLQKDWKENDRHYFQYKMDAPILNFYSFLSARYEIKKDKWINPLDKTNSVNIEIYYTKGHEYNIDDMIKGIKKSLNYYTKNFSPYQHKQVRILEFPRYQTFAQSFPNTIPFSEGIGFIAKVDETDPNKVDYPFYVTAHEVAHQWWAHQVIGANVQGCTVMSETMSQYSALMVMEDEYGQASMSKFLRYEMNSYLKGRVSEGKKEVPLLLCENQQYIHYNKGSVIMYALKDYLGEDTLNAALKRYIKKIAFQEPPYTTSYQFYDFIKHVTPDSLKETVKDMFERIVVYDNSIKSWSFKKTAEGKFKITAKISCIKTQSDSLGKAKEVVPSNWFDMAVFSKGKTNAKQLGEVVYIKKHKITSKEQTIEFIVDKEPYMIGIDPYNKIIDKETVNNIKDVNGKDSGTAADPLSGVVVKSE
ncbi:MAG: ABC transporter permease [Bacteroidetes bacterium]|nr:ABC transporter permease [Bacteroidota bacterium]